MSGFWITGIAINLLALVGMGFWAVRAWKQSGAPRRPHADPPHAPDVDTDS
ncbi:MAG: hypothetical protein M9885_08930 [Burkholderiaceae bacterium]|nr:hypothetical protein [Burkholderiaceae bacterium]